MGSINEFIKSKFQEEVETLTEIIEADIEDFEGEGEGENAAVKFIGNIFSDTKATWFEFRVDKTLIWATTDHEDFRIPRRIAVLTTNSIEEAKSFSQD